MSFPSEEEALAAGVARNKSMTIKKTLCGRETVKLPQGLLLPVFARTPNSSSSIISMCAEAKNQ